MNTKFSEDSFVAFLAFAGPPPTYNVSTKFRNAEEYQRAVDSRLDYVDRCNTFCQEYFSKEYDEQWIEFYKDFLRWFRKKEMEHE